MNVDGYLLEERLVHDDASSIYRGIRLENRQRIILKTPARPHSTRAELTRYRNELAVAEHLADCGAIARPIELRHQGERVFLVFEDTGGRALSELLTAPLVLGRALRIGAAIADSLAKIHNRAVIHKDIKPANILIDPSEQHAWIIDFDIATRLPSEHREVESPAAIEGTWAYMSPEQTGRMNRGIDYRTDLYSLGVTLYRMLTGVLPLHADDALEWCHVHMTREPLAPHLLRPELPPVLSALVLKLLAKVAEERYHSAEGLAHDLRRCERLLHETGKIDMFPLGEADFARGLHIPQKLYGREDELAELHGCFAEVARYGTCGVAVIGGYSGVGKSSLVRELHKPIVAARGHFIAGKLEQYQRDIPCYPLIQAMGGLLRQILGGSDDGIEAWRSRLREALGSNGRVISELIPELELLLGPQPEIPALGPGEAKNRFSLTFRNFTRALATADGPLVMVLDDMQWADPGTLDLLEALLTDEALRYVCVLLAYRDNEIHSTHPFVLALRRLERAGIALCRLRLMPLELSSVVALVSDALHADPTEPEVVTLAGIIRDKTGGNPFFVIQFLKRLHRDGLLFQDPASGRMGWDCDGVARREYTANVVEHMVEYLRLLPAATQETLMLAACMGTSFDLDDLRAIDDRPRSHVAEWLWPAVVANLIVPVGKSHGLPAYLDEPGARELRVRYRFQHDRIRQAAYSVLSEDRRVATHLHIGRTWRRRARAGTLEARVFDIVDQLNHGLALITDPGERLDLAELNLRAGDKARAATAYASALRHLELARELLPEDAWQQHYEIAYAVSRTLAECHYLCGELELAEEMFARCIERVRTEPERGTIYALRSNLAQHAGDYARSVALALEGLARLGVDVPPDAASAQAAAEPLMSEVAALWASRTLEQIREAGPIESATVRAIIDLIAETGSSAYLACPPYFPWLALTGIKLAILHGNARTTGLMYSNYALLTLLFRRDARAALPISRMGIELSERQDNRLLLARQLFVHGTFISHWTQPITDSIELLERAFAISRDAGDLLWAGFAASAFGPRLECAATISDLVASIRLCEAFARRSKNDSLLPMLQLGLQFCACLQGSAPSLTSMDDQHFSEQECLEACKAMGIGTSVAWVYVFRQILYCYNNQYSEALAPASEGKAYIEHMAGQCMEVNHRFYSGLALCAAYPEATPDQQAAYRQEIEHIRGILARWAGDCAANYRDRHLFMEAEIARLADDRNAAMQRYEEAAQDARSRGYLHRAGLAFERAGRYALEANLTVAGMGYVREALLCYDGWGAKAQVLRLSREFPQLAMASASEALTSSSSRSSASASLDALTLIKTTQAISGELKLDRLVEKLLALAMENAGADHASLVLLDQGQPVTLFDAAGRCLPYTPAAQVPHSAIGSVLRTRTSLLLTHAHLHVTYGNDPYIAANHVYSLLCLPILQQGQLRAVLSLENRLLPDVFTPGRIALLGLIASQAAICMDNVGLYSRLEEYSYTLEHKVAERTAELARAKAAAESARAAAETASQAKSRFLAYVSHEIRTPMNAILGTTTLLLHNQLTSDQLSMIGMIRRSGDALLALINDLLDIARIEAGKMHLDEQPFALHACLRDAMELMASTAAAKGIELCTAVEPSVPDVVIGDASRLRQIVLNLLSNALKCTDRGAVTLQVAWAGSPAAGAGLHIAVRDTGIGIAPEQLETLFEPFTQQPSGRTRGGSGLGLTICRQLVELMDGRIWVESEVGKGSTFHISVALRPAREDELQQAMESPAAVLPPPAGEERAMRILLVEDNEINYTITRAILHSLGHNVVELAVNGEEAVQAMAQSTYDVVLMDVHMPRMDGLEATRRIRSRTQVVQPRIVALTASTMPDEVDACLRAGMDDYLCKPLTPDALSAALERARSALLMPQPHIPGAE